MRKNINTAIIIVNWNGRHLLGDCLGSLTRQTYKDFKIILVDNGSIDDSVDFVKDEFGSEDITKFERGNVMDRAVDKDEINKGKTLDIKIVELKENTGFARGNNIGIAKALGDKNIKNIILLNNDAKVEADFLEQLLSKINNEKFNKKYTKIGALAPKILLTSRQDLDVKKVIDAVGARVGLDGRGYSIGHGEVDEGQYDKSREVFGFCGGAVLLRREMLENIVMKGDNLAKVQLSQSCEGWTFAEYRQFFDDSFFAYYEDADLSCRMRLRGWSTITVPEAVVYHLHSATADTVKSKTFKAYYLNRNRFLMMFKNFPAGVLWKGLLLVPKSYFSNKKNRADHKEKKIFTKVTVLHNTVANVKNKIRMAGVMLKVGGSLLINLPRLIKQRWKIQKRKIVRNGEFGKWLH